MKKLLLIPILILFPIIASAQKIDYSNIDEFTGKSVIRTEWLGFGARVAFPNKGKFDSKFMLRYEEGKIFLHVEWIDSPKTIKKGSEFQLMLKDGSIVTLTSIDDFIADTNVYTSLDKNYSQNIVHIIYEGDFLKISDLNQPEKLRISTIYDSEVFDIDSKYSRRLTKSYKLILDEIKKTERK